MANAIYINVGTQFLYADHATDFGAAPATAANSLILGTPTDVQIDLTGVAASGGARQAAKANFAAFPRNQFWVLWACIEFETAPADGGTVDFYMAGSPSATAGTGNPGGTTGADAAFTDSTGNLGQMNFIGSMTVRNNVINISTKPLIFPMFAQYGNLVVVNNASTAFRSTATAMDETHIVISPWYPEVQ